MIELFRTSTFRLAMAYLALFAVSVLAVLVFIYWQTVVYADQQTDETIDAEITGLAEQYRQRGLAGLIQVIQERSDPGRGGSMLYLLTDPAGLPLAGNLGRWPDATVGPDGWMRFELDTGHRGREHVAQATSFLLAGGDQLLVGRDLAERGQFTDRIKGALIWSAALTLALGLAGGVVLSRRVLARIEAINRASDRVMAGELGRRIPLRGTGDEFDRLASNLNAMLDRIEALMQGMREVSDNIAHDLRSPLGRLRSRLEIALDEADDGRRHDLLSQAIGEADQLLATFSALLEIAAVEAGSLRADLAPLDLAGLLRGLVDLYEPVADEKGLSLTLRLPPGPLEIKGNRHLLNRGFANLVENALKYTPAPGRVAVIAEPAGEAVRVVVADTGPGVPADARDRVFDRFFRLEQSRTTPGNGLGLSLVRAVVGLHRGTIRLEDNAPGLRVVVMLPLKDREALPVRSERGQPARQVTTPLDIASPGQ